MTNSSPQHPQSSKGKEDRTYWNAQCGDCGDWFTLKGLRIHQASCEKYLADIEPVKKIEKIGLSDDGQIYLEADLVNGLVNVREIVKKIDEIIDRLNEL